MILNNIQQLRLNITENVKNVNADDLKSIKHIASIILLTFSSIRLIFPPLVHLMSL